MPEVNHFLIFKVVFLFLLTQLAGCSALHTSISKKDLDVQTKMSDTIFLEPVAPEKRIVFVDIRNTSDQSLDIESTILQSIRGRGFTITDNPEQANFMLQANILQVGRANLNGVTSALDAGFGGAVAGYTIASSIDPDNFEDAAVAGLVGAVGGIISDALVKDIMFSMITDLQVRERPLSGETITQSQTTNTSQGSSTRLNQQVSGGQVNWKTYRTRIVSTANKANLKFAEAKPNLVEGLIRSISGIF